MAILVPRNWTLGQRLDWYSRRADNGCLEWVGHVGSRGYGFLWWKGKNRLAHRLQWERITGEPPPDGFLVCHRCDNGKCIDPFHLFLGTQSDNRNDMYAKGRGHNKKGERHPMSKLTPEKVLEIRQAIGPHKEIAARFGVARQTVGDLKTRRRWAHI